MNEINEELGNLTNWAELEAIEYSEHGNPHTVLGPHMTEKGLYINVFMPTAKSVSVKLKKAKKETQMELIDEKGFFAVLLPEKKIVPYTLVIEFDNGITTEFADPYYFEPVIDAVDIIKFESGIHYDIYEKLGAHPMTVQGVKGVLFAVWAPNASRVSVVGDFNNWDGRRNPMRRLENSGIFELFMPNLTEGDIYKYELKLKGDLVILKTDPYGNYAELRPADASVIVDLSDYSWNDKEWITKRNKTTTKDKPMLVYEMHLGSWKKPSDIPESEDNKFYNYRELAPMIVDYLKEMGYTHVELMPIMEHPLDESWGYQVSGYYAVTSRYGNPKDFMYFIDYLHQNDIGVILDWVPAHFPRDTFGLSNFDGTCLYEHLDPRQGSHPHWGTLIFNYGRPQVSNFLIANALFWAKKYHIDGIRIDAVASMLYLDYGKNHGEWVANIYGGNENLEAIELLKHLNSVMKKQCKGVLVIAEESTAWEKITTDVEDGGLGFDYKWNMGWMNDFTNYMKTDPFFRKGQHGNLTFSMIYAYSEDFVLVLSHDEVVHGKSSMINKMPGDLPAKFANLRVSLGFMMAHPGKKLLFMGQEFAQFREWSEARSLDWELLDNDENKQMQQYVKALNNLYKNNKALYELDYKTDGFEWINNIDAEKSIISFLRKTKKEDETLLIVCNFTPVDTYTEYEVGVPFKGKYKEIFNSDDISFGGSGKVNPRLKQSKDIQVDERDNSITITVPPLGITVFSCTPMVTKKVADKKAITEKKIEPKKETVKKEVTKKETIKKETVKKEPIKKEPVKKATPTKVVKADDKAIETKPTSKAEAKPTEVKKPAKVEKKPSAKKEAVKETVTPKVELEPTKETETVNTKPEEIDMTLSVDTKLVPDKEESTTKESTTAKAKTEATKTTKETTQTKAKPTATKKATTVKEKTVEPKKTVAEKKEKKAVEKKDSKKTKPNKNK